MMSVKKLMKKTMALVIVGVFTLSAAACGGKKNDNSDKTPTPSSNASVTPASDATVTPDANTNDDDNNNTPATTGVKVYRTTNGGDIVTLNPHQAGSQFDLGEGVPYVFGTLTAVDPSSTSYRIIPVMAEELPVESEDGLTWTYKIRKGLTWSDGTPINAYTFEYSAKMLLDPKLANRNASTYWDSLTVVNAEAYYSGEDVAWEDVGIKATDEYTLVFTLSEPTIPLYALTGLDLYPVHEASYEAGMNEDRTETTYGTSNFLNMPTCGRYKLVEWEESQFRAYEKDYSYPIANLYPIERYESRYVADSNTTLQLFEAGLIDALSINAASYEKYAEDPRLLQSYAGQPWCYFINMGSTKNPILQDKNFRKALYYGTNREEVAKGVFKVYTPVAYFAGYSTLVGDVLAGETIAYRETPEAKAIVPENDGYNTELALEYFNQAYNDNGGQKITIDIIYFDNSDSWKRLAEVVQEQWRTLFGDRIEVTITSMDANAAYEKMYAFDYDICLGSWSQVATDMWSSFYVYTSMWVQPLNEFSNAEFDELQKRCTLGDLLRDDQGKTEALARMEEILIEEVPAIPLFQNTNMVIYSDRVKLKNREYIPGVGFVIDDIEPMEVQGFVPFEATE